MGWPEFPAATEIELVHYKLDHLKDRQDRMVEAINGLGANIQWVIDNAKGIFQMFQSPEFMASLPGMMNPAAMTAAANEMKDNGGSADAG